jgi:hypothetical protein
MNGWPNDELAAIFSEQNILSQPGLPHPNGGQVPISDGSHGNRNSIIIGITCGTAVFLLIMGVVIFFTWKHKKQTQSAGGDRSISQEQLKGPLPDFSIKYTGTDGDAESTLGPSIIAPSPNRSPMIGCLVQTPAPILRRLSQSSGISAEEYRNVRPMSGVSSIADTIQDGLVLDDEDMQAAKKHEKDCLTPNPEAMHEFEGRRDLGGWQAH